MVSVPMPASQCPTIPLKMNLLHKGFFCGFVRGARRGPGRMGMATVGVWRASETDRRGSEAVERASEAAGRVLRDGKKTTVEHGQRFHLPQQFL